MLRQGPAKTSVGAGCHRLEGETRRFIQGHSIVVVRVRGTARFGDGGVSGDEVPLMWCDGRKHEACAIVPSMGCAGHPAPAPGTRLLPNVETHIDPPPGEKQGSF